MKEPLTKRQQSIFDWIAAYIKQHKFSPTYSEIAGAFKSLAGKPLTRSAVQGHLRLMEAKGYVETNGAIRGIFIPKKK